MNASITTLIDIVLKEKNPSGEENKSLFIFVADLYETQGDFPKASDLYRIMFESYG